MQMCRGNLWIAIFIQIWEALMVIFLKVNICYIRIFAGRSNFMSLLPVTCKHLTGIMMQTSWRKLSKYAFFMLLITFISFRKWQFYLFLKDVYKGGWNGTASFLLWSLCSDWDRWLSRLWEGLTLYLHNCLDLMWFLHH